jgi:hypothetical protein
MHISLKGIFKNDKQYTREDRYKFDALEYYNTDVDWFAFIFIMFVINLSIAGAEWTEVLKEFYTGDNKVTSKEPHVLYICIIIRIF